MTQLPLFTPSGAPSRPRRVKPSTPSSEARERHEASGRMGAHCRMVLDALKAAHPDAMTAWELSEGMLLDPVEIRRRLHDLWKASHITHFETRICAVAGKRAKAWRANEAP